jgi:uncharacterized protein involved in exopolysaccharide biosynthesis
MSRSSRTHRDLAEYGLLIGRHRWLTIGSPLAGIAAGLALFALTPPTYTATAQVLVTPTGVQDQTNQIGPRQRESLNLDTEAQIAQSAVVAARAAETLGIQDSDALRRQIAVNVPPNSAILSISYVSSSPVASAAGAQAFASAYLANRQAAADQALSSQQRLLTTTLRDVNRNLNQVTRSLPTLAKGSSGRLMATQRQSVLSRQVYSLTARVDTLKTVAVTPGSVISAARPPARPSGPVLPVFAGSGLFLGLLIGAGAATARERQPSRRARL